MKLSPLAHEIGIPCCRVLYYGEAVVRTGKDCGDPPGALPLTDPCPVFAPARGQSLHPEKLNVLVMGPAKTGTTVISKTIQHSLPGAQYHLEPKRALFFERGALLRSKSSQVVKIIFEHWAKAPRLRSAIVHNELSLKFDKLVAIVRDPRDELLSRMMYVIHPHIMRKGYDAEVVDQWVRTLERKEAAPAEVSVLDMLDKLKELIGHNGLGVLGQPLYRKFLQAHRKQLFVVKYEDFIQGRTEQLESYLGFELSKRRDVGHLERTARTRAFDNWKRYFTPRDVEALRGPLLEAMEEWGYLDWELETPDRLDPDHGSRYVARLVEDTRR